MTLTRPRDPLLAVARLCTTGLMALFVIAGVAVVIAAVALLALPALMGRALADGHLIVRLGEAGQGLTPAMLTPGFLAGVALVLVIAAGMIAAAFQFVRLLRRIIDTVGLGDPFIPANAARLGQMAWLLVGIELATLPLNGLCVWLVHRAQSPEVTIDVDLSLSNLFVALVLFILARVFREGARLRDEVEGTV